VHTVILPHAVAFNSEAVPEAMRIVAEALGVKEKGTAAQGLYDLAAAVGAPVALKDIGMPADGLERAAELATQNPYANPRPVEYASVLELLRNAYSGRRPA
jgi:maleylacetate reductase